MKSVVFSNIHSCNIRDDSYIIYPNEIGCVILNDYVQVPKGTRIKCMKLSIRYNKSSSNNSINISSYGSMTIKFIGGIDYTCIVSTSNVYLPTSSNSFTVTCIYDYSSKPIFIDSFVCAIEVDPDTSPSIVGTSSNISATMDSYCAMIYNTMTNTNESFYIEYSST